MHKHFPGWTLVIGGLLAVASILPILIVFILRITGLSSPHVDYEPGSPMKRVETNASTHPMMVKYKRRTQTTRVVYTSHSHPDLYHTNDLLELQVLSIISQNQCSLLT